MFAVGISLTLNHSPSTRVSYFAVFDGHGGIRASKFAAQNLHQNLIRKFPKGEIEINQFMFILVFAVYVTH